MYSIGRGARTERKDDEFPGAGTYELPNASSFKHKGLEKRK